MSGTEPTNTTSEEEADIIVITAIEKERIGGQ